jgi:hypothetical protein
MELIAAEWEFMGTRVTQLSAHWRLLRRIKHFASDSISKGSILTWQTVSSELQMAQSPPWTSMAIHPGEAEHRFPHSKLALVPALFRLNSSRPAMAG